jgi:hypothetical protein
MNRKDKHKKQRRVVMVAVATLASIVAVGVATFLIWQYVQKSAEPNINKPLFSLDTDKAPDWWTSGSSWLDDYDVVQYEDSAPLPIVSILAFQGVKNANDRLDRCFVSASYYEGNIDTNSALKEKEAGMVKGRENSTSLIKLGELTLRIKTSEGDKEYILHQYDLTPPEGEEFQRGNEFGYIQMTDGYVYIFGVCPTANMLDSTIPAISALELKL